MNSQIQHIQDSSFKVPNLPDSHWINWGFGRFVQSKPDPHHGSSYWCFMGDKPKSDSFPKIRINPKFGDRPMHQTSNDFLLGDLPIHQWTSEHKQQFDAYGIKDFNKTIIRYPKPKSFLDTLDETGQENVKFDWPGPYPRFEKSLWSRMRTNANPSSSYRDEFHLKQDKSYLENKKIRKERQKIMTQGSAGDRILKHDSSDYKSAKSHFQKQFQHFQPVNRQNSMKLWFTDLSPIYVKIPSKQKTQNFHRISGDLKLAIQRL